MDRFLIPFAFVASCLFLSSTALANPVSFKDGYGLMTNYMEDRFDTEFNYSLTNRYAFGISSINLLNYKKGTPHFQFAKFNYLIKRWNELESQSNVYVSLGAGARQASDHNSLAGRLSLEADYETRRIYTSAQLEHLQSASDLDFTRLRYRAGFAPYKAPFESLQTWLIAQIDYTSNLEDDVTVTPLVRFFYNNIALEVGSSIDGEVFVGTMFHF